MKNKSDATKREKDTKKENKSDCKLVIFSDLHYAPEKPIENGSRIDRKLMHYAEPLLYKLIDKINNEIKPDMAINLGDLIEDFRDHDKDLVNIAYIWNILQGLKVQFYSITGNHDLRAMDSRVEVERIMGYKHSTFAVDLKGYHLVFIGLDVDNQKGLAEGGIYKTQFMAKQDLQWLKEDLDKNTLPCIVFAHFGIAEDDMKGNWWFESCRFDAVFGNRKEIKEILKKDKNLLAVFSGHQHWTKKLIEDGIDYYVVGSLTEDINNNGVPDGVYFEIDLMQGKLCIKEHHLRL